MISPRVFQIMPVRTFVFMTFVLMQVSCSTNQPDSSTNQESLEPSGLQGKAVLFVYGGWEGHQPEACRDLFVPWLQEAGATVIESKTLDVYADSILMAGIDLIVQIWTMGEISADQLHGLLNAVESGTGFAGWHGGIIDAFRGSLEYDLLTGAQFLTHPGGEIPYSVHITDPRDPVMAGIHDFDVVTEQYYLLTDPNMHVLATTTFDDQHLKWIKGHTMPVIWKKSYGSGHVFVSTLGHSTDVLSKPEVQKTLERGFVWACRR